MDGQVPGLRQLEHHHGGGGDPLLPPGGPGRLEPGRLKELKEYPSLEKIRVKTGIGELNRVLGGGIVKGSVVLAGGEPGIGKSTLFLQAADSLCRRGKVLYVSGEESPEQVRLRSERLGLSSQMLFLAETQLEIILAAAETAKPEFLVVDSIQTIYSQEGSSAPGSVSQVRACASALARLAKETGTAGVYHWPCDQGRRHRRAAGAGASGRYRAVF